MQRWDDIDFIASPAVPKDEVWFVGPDERGELAVLGKITNVRLEEEVEEKKEFVAACGCCLAAFREGDLFYRVGGLLLCGRCVGGHGSGGWCPERMR